MVRDRQARKSGRISFPIFPTIVVFAVLAVLASMQFSKQSNTPATEFSLENADIHGTQIKPIDAQKIDFIVYLSPSGTKRLNAWLMEKPNSEISVSYGDKILGKITLSPDMDKTALHLDSPVDKAMTARYVIGR